MNRRTWIKWTAGSGGAAAVAGSIGYVKREEILRLQASDFSDLIRENFHYLKLEVTEEQIEAFHALYIKHNKHIARGIFLRLKGYDEDHVSEQLDEMLMTFLLSTDFFLNGADESKPVKYASFFNPYVTPCWNPISLAAAAAPA